MQRDPEMIELKRKSFNVINSSPFAAKMPSMFRDYLEMVVGFNQPITKKAQFINYYLTALSGKKDIRAHEKHPEPYRSIRGPVADRVNDANYRYQPLSSNIYGLTPRRITAKQQREQE